MTAITQKEVQAGARIIQQATQDHLKKKMSLQTAIATSAKVLGLKNAHIAQREDGSTEHGDTWLVVGHYFEDNQVFVDIVTAADGFEAFIASAKERCGDDQECPDYFVAIKKGTGEMQFASDENLSSVNGEDLKEFFAEEEVSATQAIEVPPAPAEMQAKPVNPTPTGTQSRLLASTTAEVDEWLKTPSAEIIDLAKDGKTSFSGMAELCFEALARHLPEALVAIEEDGAAARGVPLLVLLDEDEFSNVLRTLPGKAGLAPASACIELRRYVAQKIWWFLLKHGTTEADRIKLAKG